MAEEPLKEERNPFIPGTNIQWCFDSTSLGLFKTCPRLYKFVMLEGWKPRHQSVHLTFGIIYHSAIEHHEKNLSSGIDYETSLRLVADEALEASWPWPFDHSTKTRETLLRSIIWYLETFRSSPAKTVQLKNGKPAVELSFQFDLDEGPEEGYTYALAGHLDQIIEMGEELFVNDHKTSSSDLGSWYFEKYNPDLQMSLYSLAASVVYSLPISGVMIDAAQVLVKGTRFARGFTYRTPEQLREFLTETKGWMKLQALHARMDFWPANEKSCSNFGGCSFREICAKSPSSRQAFLEGNFVKGEKWNPLKER